MILLATSREDLDVISAEPVVVVFLSVEWSGPERLSRRVFSEFGTRVAERHPRAFLPFWIVNEETEGVVEWLRDLGLSESLSAGSGAVVWLSRGQTIASEINAAVAGVTGLESRTLALLGLGT